MGDNDEQILETYIRACFKFAIVMVPTLLAFIFDVWIVSYCDLSGYKAYLYPSIALLCTYAIYRLLLWAVKLTPAEEDIFDNNFDYPSSPSTENIDANNFAIRIDPKYLGVPNVCFSLSDEDDPREPIFAFQFVVNQDHINGSPSEEDKEKYAEGMKLFAENFHRLWT
jgi:hypothetical protein